jgi:hypothetical protein
MTLLDGGLNWEKVTAVTNIEIVDYPERKRKCPSQHDHDRKK